VVLDPLTAAERRFKTMDGFRRHFMAELSRGELTYLVCEARLLDRALLGLESRHARKVFVFHSTHLRPGSNVVRTGNRAVLKNLSQADALVVLTPQQRDHIVDRFGFADRVRVIPHSVKAQSATGERTPGLVVVVARLSPEKNVGAAIRAFAKVRRARPDARLEIWGHGEEEPALKGLAEDLGLGEAVRFAGYAPGAAAAFARAECSLLTSRWEGLGLTVMESMAVGTPCVAYDLDYGPAALIEDGVSGSLVPQGDEDALAGRLLVLLNASPADKQAMSKAAADRMADFSQERLAARWSELFDSLRHPVATRPPLVKRLWRRIPDGPRERLGALLGL
jgi:poly(glycerol-phosphate) alpha-glucosyltransferase